MYWPSPTAKEPQYLAGSWAPRLNFNVQGPLEGGSQISVRFAKPGGVKWFSRDLKTDETAADSFQSFSLDGNDLEKQAMTLTGVFTLTVALTNALSGTNKTLYVGKFEVNQFHYGSAPNEIHQADYYVNHDWTLPIGQMSFDDNAEAPTLRVNLWFRGPLDMEMLAGYLYYNGKQITSTKSAGSVGATTCHCPGTSTYAILKAIASCPKGSKDMAQKAKQRTKTPPMTQPVQNGNGFHNNGSRLPGDPLPDHPLASIAGSYKDDPFWDEFIQAMKNARREEDERLLKDWEA